MNSSLKSKHVKIHLDIGDQLTAISCGHVVVELIKFIVYQRLQIPYTYPWLKQVINKKKNCEEENEVGVKDGFQSERHFRAASNALENLDFILKGLLQEINGSSIPEEVCVTLGATPMTCKEVYRLLLPTTCHKPQCHSTLIASDQKIKRNVFRTLVTSEKLSQVFFSALTPTNTHVFIKKKGNQDSVTCTDFIYTTGYRIPRNSKVVVIDFRIQDLDTVACCNDFQIFGDVTNDGVEKQIDDDSDDILELESTDDMRWYQSSYVMKGFKDCVINGNSVINSWLSS